MTESEFLWSYAEYLNDRRLAEGTRKLYLSMAERVIRLKPKRYADMKILLNDGLSISSIRLYRSLLNSLFDYGVRQGFLERNLMKDAPRPPRADRKLPDPLCEGEWESFWKLIPTPHCRLAAGLMRYGGLRLSESCRVRPRHLTPADKGLLWVRVESGKGRKDRDTLITDAPFCRLLESHRTKGTYAEISPSGIRQAFYRISKKMKANIHPHRLRHTYATDLYSKGVPLEIIRQMLGHENIGTTEIYTEIKPSRILDFLAG